MSCGASYIGIGRDWQDGGAREERVRRKQEPEVIGLCPVCEREMWAGSSVDRHHFVPRSRGGKASEHVHRVCHSKIHSLFTLQELEREYADPEAVRAHPDMQLFIRWVRKKPPDFRTRNDRARRKRRA
jgi:5-methylcytosine-specific restriction endonuclease McrA